MYLVTIGSFFKHWGRVLIRYKPALLVLIGIPECLRVGRCEMGHSWCCPEPESRDLACGRGNLNSSGNVVL